MSFNHIVSFMINDRDDRDRMVNTLARHGYLVTVREEQSYGDGADQFYVDVYKGVIE